MPDQKPDPSAQSGDRKAMSAAWTLISDVLAGATAIRAKGATYLPKYEGEDDKEYGRRKQVAPWRPEFADALQSLASKPFGKDVGLKDGASERIKSLAEDVDGRGNSQTAFARETFAKAIAKGFHLILVDYPAMHTGEDGEAPKRPLTIAEEQAAGARPYWIQVQADDVLALYTRWDGGREVIEHLRLREGVTVRDGFGERTVERVRVYEPGRWEVWEQNASKDWERVAQGVIARGPKNASSVPAVLFFTGERLGEMRVKPPLEELAHCQIELYQALSRQDEILTFASSPMLTANGLSAPTDGSAIAVGPKTILYAPGGGEGSTPSWEYINPDASNIEQVRKHVESIIADMRRLGMQPATPRSGTVTATGESIGAARAHSALQAWAIGLKDAFEQAYVFTAEWLGDSRGYRLRAGLLELLTTDHTIAWLGAVHGWFAHDSPEARTARYRLTRYAGHPDAPEPDLLNVALRAGDRFLLCTDGLTDQVPYERIQAVLEAGGTGAADSLLADSLAAGGTDNATAVIVEVG